MKLRDYIHLYPGCKVEVFEEDTQGNYTDTIIGLCPGESINLARAGDWYFEENNDFGIKLLLRPLSGITEKESEECWVFAKMGGGIVNHKSAIQGHFFRDCNIRQMSAMIDWLRNNEFDTDGLIEAGLAIDKTIKTGK